METRVWLTELGMRLADAPAPGGRRVSVPILGAVGADTVERLFCQRAHQCVRGELTPQAAVATCPALKARMCGLCGYKTTCLFTDLYHPDWEQIRQSERVVKEPGSL